MYTLWPFPRLRVPPPAKMLGNTKNIKLGHTSGGQANVSTREHVTSLSGFFNCYDGLQRTCELVSHKQAINPFVLQRKRATDRSTFYKLPPPPVLVLYLLMFTRGWVLWRHLIEVTNIEHRARTSSTENQGPIIESRD